MKYDKNIYRLGCGSLSCDILWYWCRSLHRRFGVHVASNFMVKGSAWTEYQPSHFLSLSLLDQSLYIYKHSLTLHLDAEGADSMYIRNVGNITHIHKL
jgi:hypothetical protein